MENLQTFSYLWNANLHWGALISSSNERSQGWTWLKCLQSNEQAILTEQNTLSLKFYSWIRVGLEWISLFNCISYSKVEVVFFSPPFGHLQVPNHQPDLPFTQQLSSVEMADTFRHASTEKREVSQLHKTAKRSEKTATWSLPHYFSIFCLLVDITAVPSFITDVMIGWAVTFQANSWLLSLISNIVISCCVEFTNSSILTFCQIWSYGSRELVYLLMWMPNETRQMNFSSLAMSEEGCIIIYRY